MQVQEVLHSRRLPARLTTAQAGQLLGFLEHEMGVLMRVKLLKPLGNPSANARKYFSTVEVLALTNDSNWLDKATKAVARAWQHKNAKAKGRGDQNLETAA
jgi:hypothetical protein